MAVLTGEDAAAVEDRYPAAAADDRANEPVTRAAQIARRSFDAHGVPFVLPFSPATPVPINQDHTVIFDLHLKSTPLVRRRASTGSEQKGMTRSAPGAGQRSTSPAMSSPRPPSASRARARVLVVKAPNYTAHRSELATEQDRIPRPVGSPGRRRGRRSCCSER